MAEPSTCGPRASWRDDLVTTLSAAWLMVGLFVDGWAHNHGKPESFFTPWHGLFYSGFLAAAAWTIRVSRRHGREPAGYRLGLVGVGIFAVGGVADMAWHQVFGIEVGLEALFSPSHLMLFVGAILILTTPLRSAWSDPGLSAPGFRALFPALLSVTLATALVAFFLMPYSPFIGYHATAEPYRYITGNVAPEVGNWLAEEIRTGGLASFLLATVVLVAPVLLLVRRWRLPFGSLTFLFTSVAVLMAGLDAFATAGRLPAALAGGLTADLLVRRLRPGADRPAALRTLAAVVPSVMWLTYFACLAASDGIGWPVELWAGAATASALAGVGLSLLAAPPALPAPPARAAPATAPTDEVPVA